MVLCLERLQTDLPVHQGNGQLSGYQPISMEIQENSWKYLQKPLIKEVKNLREKQSFFDILQIGTLWSQLGHATYVKKKFPNYWSPNVTFFQIFRRGGGALNLI